MEYTPEQILKAKQEFLDKYNPKRTIAKALEQSNGAAVKRARLYTNGLSHIEREPVRSRLKKHLETLQHIYSHAITRSVHYTNIVALCDHMNNLPKDVYFAHQAFVTNPGFRIAHSQKSIAVFLKHLWCMGIIPTPPECPVDSIILTKVGIRSISWSSINDIKVHEKIVDDIRRISGANCLAEWELITFKYN